MKSNHRMLKRLIVIISIILFIVSLILPSMEVSSVHNHIESEISIPIESDPTFESKSHIGLIPLIGGLISVMLIALNTLAMFTAEYVKMLTIFEVYYLAIWFANPLYFIAIIYFILGDASCFITSLISTILILFYVVCRPELASGEISELLFDVSRSSHAVYSEGVLFKQHVYFSSLDIGFWFWFASSLVILLGSYYFYQNDSDIIPSTNED